MLTPLGSVIAALFLLSGCAFRSPVSLAAVYTHPSGQANAQGIGLMIQRHLWRTCHVGNPCAPTLYLRHELHTQAGAMGLQGEAQSLDIFLTTHWRLTRPSAPLQAKGPSQPCLTPDTRGTSHTDLTQGTRDQTPLRAKGPSQPCLTPDTRGLSTAMSPSKSLCAMPVAATRGVPHASPSVAGEAQHTPRPTPRAATYAPGEHANCTAGTDQAGASQGNSPTLPHAAVVPHPHQTPKAYTEQEGAFVSHTLFFFTKSNFYAQDVALRYAENMLAQRAAHTLRTMLSA